MTEQRVLPYGSWASPITIERALASNLSIHSPRLDGGDVYWTEGRPAEGGRNVIVRRDAAGVVSDVVPPPYNARTMANEYGGGAYCVGAGTVYFSNLADGRIYAVAPGGEPSALTAEGPYRYGDLVFDAARRRLLCVLEDHTGDSEHAEPRASLVAVDLATGSVAELASGCDFYSTPRPSPDGTRLAYLAWRHPNMPWDATELWLAELDDSGAVREQQLVAGGDEESVVQPEWAPDGSLVYASDRSGWWNLYRRTASGESVAVWPRAAEFAGPQWVFGLTWFGIAADGSIVAIVRSGGTDTLWHIPVSGEPRRLDVHEQSIAASIQVAGQLVCYVGAGARQPLTLATFDLDTGGRTVLRQLELGFDEAYLSSPKAIEFPTSNGQTAHALFYPPTNPDFRAPDGERPPLVVMIHGGPTSAAVPALDLKKQLFTSRGFAVVDVNYRGSTGYGREYMRLLDDKWGIYDIDDCVAAARYLADRGSVDPERMAITGGSAGGYTVLRALTTRDVFAAGASHFGVGDLEALARDTHKFESRYLDRLVAPYPERVATYRERSPIYAVDRLRRPLIVTQGRDDMVVPIAQAEQIVAALRERRIPHAYLPFDGEGHGYRQAHNIRRALEAELSFYAQVFGFELADDFAPVEVEFL